MVKDNKRTTAFSRLQDLGIPPSQLLKPCQVQVCPSLSDGCDCWSSHLHSGYIPEVHTCIKRILMQLPTQRATDSPTFVPPLCSLPQFTCSLPTGNQVLILLLVLTVKQMHELAPFTSVLMLRTLQILAEALSPIPVLAPWTCAAVSTELGSFQMQFSCCPAVSLLVNYTRTQD